MRFLKNKYIAVLIAALMVLCAFAFGLNGKPLERGKFDNYYVTDTTGMIEPPAMSRIEQMNKELYDLCGSEIALAVVRTTGSNSIIKYAEETFEKWKVSNRGVLVVMALDDQDYYALCGVDADYALAGFLGDMLDYYLEPYFAMEQYSQGAISIVSALSTELGGYYTDTAIFDDTGYYSGEYYSQYTYSSVYWSLILLLVVIVLIVAFSTSISIGRRRRAFYYPVYPRRSIWFGGHHHHSPHGHMPPHAGRPSAPRPNPQSGFGRGSFGGGAGRNTSSFGSSRPSAPRPPSGFGGGSKPSGFGRGSFGGGAGRSSGGSRGGFSGGAGRKK